MNSLAQFKKETKQSEKSAEQLQSKYKEALPWIRLVFKNGKFN